MTPMQTIAKARALLAGIKAKIEEGTKGRATSDDGCYVWFDDSMVADTSCGAVATRLDLANARLIAAAHNAMPTALEDIEADLLFIESIASLVWEWQSMLMLARKLALLETLAREFGVEVEA